MRGAFGKPYGTAARVKVGQIILSVRTKEEHLKHAVEALRRAKFKYPGRQKIVVSKKWGFTDIPKDQYPKLKEEGKLDYKGVYVHIRKNHGPLEKLKYDLIHA